MKLYQFGFIKAHKIWW